MGKPFLKWKGALSFYLGRHISFFDVFVCVQMIHTVFVAALALGAVAEFHAGTLLVRPSADRALMAAPAHRADSGLSLKILSAFYLSGTVFLKIPGHQEVDNEIGQAHENSNAVGQSSPGKAKDQQERVKKRQPLGLYGQNKVNVKIFLRKCGRIGKEYGQRQIIGVEVHIPAREKIYKKLRKNDPKHSHKKENIESECSPDRLQRLAQRIIHEHSKNDPERT